MREVSIWEITENNYEKGEEILCTSQEIGQLLDILEQSRIFKKGKILDGEIGSMNMMEEALKSNGFN